MPNYRHGIATTRDTSINVDPAVAQYGIQCIIGTAPVNTLADPSKAVNKPIACYSMAEFESNFGKTSDYESYTLSQAAYMAFKKFAVGPIICINVLDPSVLAHKTAVAAAEKDIVDGKVIEAVEGIILSSVVITKTDDTAVPESVTVEGVTTINYLKSIDGEGNLVIAPTSDGALAGVTKLKLAYAKLNPSGVTAGDIIGGLSANNVRTGIELVDEVYSTTGLIPFILLAPKFSENTAVATALEAKAQLAGDLTNGIAIVDIESSETVNYKNVYAKKQSMALTTRWVVPCWPMVKVDGRKFSMSSVVGSLLQSICVENNGVPADSPDNRLSKVQAACLADGTEIHMTKNEANDYLNAYGVNTCIYIDGWKFWGNNTAAYPSDADTNDRFIKCVMVSNYLEDRFKTEYLSSVGRTGSVKRIQSVVSNYNIALNALIGTTLAGAEVVFNASENPMSEIIEGRFKFHTRYADFTPMEYIENTFTWDSSILEAAFEGGE